MFKSRRRCLSLLPALLIALASIFGTSAISLAQSETQSSSEPQVGAAAAIVVEFPSGRILYQKAAHDKLPPASLTKIMTAILALEYGNLNDVITVVPEDLVGESTMGLVSGEQQTLHDLLYGMLLPSGNDAAMAIARYLGGHLDPGTTAAQDPVARFADMMNVRVSQLGLTDTHFVTPHGLDAPDHFSSAYDLASLTWYALHISTFNDIVKSVSYEAPGHSLLNTNEMLTRYEGADGVKTGWTDGCGLCLVTSATRNGHRLISVVLNAPQWYSDSAVLLDYGFSVLSAAPTDPQAETLSIAKRDAVSWLLADATSLPPVSQAQQAPAEPTAALAQGGGSAANQAIAPDARSTVAASNEQAPLASRAALAPASASGGSQAAPEAASTHTLGATQTGPNLVLIVAIVALALSACLALAARFLSPQRKALLYTALSFIPGLGGNGLPAAGPDRSYDRSLQGGPKRDGLSGHVGPNHVLQLPRTARREPNLLATADDEIESHIQLAIAHAAEGRQGSGMSEFVLALKSGADIDVADLAQQYRLSAAAFLALSRAQVALGKTDQARRTLLHAVLVLPADRMLRLALYQLPPLE